MRTSSDDPRIWEADEGKFQVQNYLGLHSEIFSSRKINLEELQEHIF